MTAKKTKIPLSLIKDVKDTVLLYNMLKKGDRVLVAVSGGADSVSLLMVLSALRRVLGVDLVVANLDHSVRGERSAEDSRFVKALAEELCLEYFHEKLKLSALAGGKSSLEEKLRRKRYDFFVRAARKSDCGVIATGHNMDDQAETVIMRLIKGVSADGLAGIPPVRMEGDIMLIRPLIRTPRKKIMAFISASKAAYVEDETNSDINFLRNRVRKEVLPFLEKINPGIRTSLVNIADSLREEALFSLPSRKKAAEGLILSSGGYYYVPLKKYLAQGTAVKREIFKQLFCLSGGNVKKLSHRHWMLMDVFARTQSKGRSLDLPGGLQVVKSKGRLLFERSRV